jgi:histidinol-phosphate/aromatic aminotransferase/cobyric acid decarboxylase-like protein
LDEKAEEALIKSIKAMEFNRYPDSDYTELKAAISSMQVLIPLNMHRQRLGRAYKPGAPDL